MTDPRSTSTSRPQPQDDKIATVPGARLIAWLVVAWVLSLLLVLATSGASQAAAPGPSESRSRREGPAPGYRPCPVAAPRPAAGYAPATGCVSGLPLDAAVAQLVRQDAVAGDEAAAEEPGAQAQRAQHPGAQHPEAVLYEIRNGTRQLLVIDLWCLRTVRKPVGVRSLC